MPKSSRRTARAGCPSTHNSQLAILLGAPLTEGRGHLVPVGGDVELTDQPCEEVRLQGGTGNESGCSLEDLVARVPPPPGGLFDPGAAAYLTEQAAIAMTTVVTDLFLATTIIGALALLPALLLGGGPPPSPSSAGSGTPSGERHDRAIPRSAPENPTADD